MATEKPSYTPTQWKNENEGGDVPDINAENLNHIEQGLKDIYDYAIEKLLNNDDFVSKLVERIVNTGTTSVAGYAADARQLNPNQSGSLAQQITQLNSNLVPTKRYLSWQSTVSEIGTSYSLKFGNWVYVHAGFTTVSGLSSGNDLTILIGSGSMQAINNIAAISDKGEIGVFRVNETNLQAGGTIPSGQTFILDLVIPLQS